MTVIEAVKKGLMQSIGDLENVIIERPNSDYKLIFCTDQKLSGTPRLCIQDWEEGVTENYFAKLPLDELTASDWEMNVRPWNATP